MPPTICVSGWVVIHGCNNELKGTKRKGVASPSGVLTGPSEAATFGSVMFPAGEATVELPPAAEELPAVSEELVAVMLAEAVPLMEVRLAPGDTMSRRHWGTLVSAERAGILRIVCVGGRHIGDRCRTGSDQGVRPLI